MKKEWVGCWGHILLSLEAVSSWRKKRSPAPSNRIVVISVFIRERIQDGRGRGNGQSGEAYLTEKKLMCIKDTALTCGLKK